MKSASGPEIEVVLVSFSLDKPVHLENYASVGKTFTQKCHKSWPIGLKVKGAHKDAYSTILSHACFFLALLCSYKQPS
jgi:hypothetical protein